MLSNFPQAHPGCLAASFAYQDLLFNKDLNKFNADGMLGWRTRFRERLRAIAERYPAAARSRPRRARQYDLHPGGGWADPRPRTDTAAESCRGRSSCSAISCA